MRDLVLECKLITFLFDAGKCCVWVTSCQISFGAVAHEKNLFTYSPIYLFTQFKKTPSELGRR